MSELKTRCARARGRSISRSVVLHLIGAAGGFCEKRGCPTGSLWHELPDGGAVKLAEVAHIVAASDDGPRGDAEVLTTDLVTFQNLILLCPTCHAIVDGAPEAYPAEMLQAWKAEHEGRLRELLGVRVFQPRAEARVELKRLLAENRSVWELYGPHTAAAETPEGSRAWLREVEEVILPNNTRISALLEANVHLLKVEEHSVVAVFDAHRRGVEARHLGMDVGVAAPRFPVEVEKLYSE